MVEIKAVEILQDVHKAQAINYCEAYTIADGLLINFGAKSLEYKRVYNKKLVSPNHVHPLIQIKRSDTFSTQISHPVIPVFPESCTDKEES
ncbi:MAG: GxxExxY protein [Chitinispirillaceae bacterium]|nr:GxxExxY protein [Chitinispirillaceae bacterium]